MRPKDTNDMLPVPPPPPPPPPPFGGYTTPYNYQPGPVTQTSGLAVASMVLGIISILLWWLWGIVSLTLGILAIVFAARTPRGQNGSRSGMATAGLVTGIIGSVFGALFFVLVLAVAIGGRSGG